jgi:copper oxidase (laccase) domain-containing protein
MTTTTSTSRRSSSDALTARIRQAAGDVLVRCSTAGDGDFHRTAIPLDELDRRRRRFVDLPWTMLDQRHGVGVQQVTTPGEHDGSVGDICATDLAGTVLGCWVADCAPVVVVGSGRRFAIAHAGWRGLARGVLPIAVDAVDEPVAAMVLGPSIGPCCYEFGADELDAVATGVGLPVERVIGRTVDGAPALDVPAVVAAFAAERGVRLVRIGGCTGCTHPGFSHRVRRDRERFVVAAWRSWETMR